MVRFLLIVISSVLSIYYNSPIELTEFGNVFLKVLGNYNLYENHISFSKEFYNSPIVSFSHFLSILSSAFELETSRILEILFILSCIFSFFILSKIIDLLSFEENQKYICYVIVFFLWLLDTPLVGVKWQLSTLNDEIRHYIIGLPVLLVSTFLFLKNKFLGSILFWTIIPWISLNTFLIGAPVGIASMLRLILRDTKKTYIYISFVFLPLIIFLIQKFPVNTISTSKSEWFYSLVFMPKHDSYFHNIINNENVGINRIPGGFSLGGVLSMVCFFLISYDLFKKLKDVSYKKRSANLKILELSLYSVAMFFLVVFINDILNIRFLIGKEILSKTFWFANFGAMFIYLSFTFNSSKNFIYILTPIIFFPLYMWENGYIFYILFLFVLISENCFSERKMQLYKFIVPFFSFLLIIYSIFYSISMLTVVAFFLLGIYTLEFFIPKMLIHYRVFKLYKVILPSLLIIFFVFAKSIRNQFLLRPIIEFNEKSSDDDFREICNKITNDFLEGVVLIPPGHSEDGIEFASIYYETVSNPVLSYYYPSYLLRSGIIEPSVFKKNMISIWGENAFKNQPSFYRQSNVWFNNNLKLIWENLSEKHMEKLKTHHDLTMIVRQNTLPLKKEIIFKNKTYTIYKI